MQVSKHPIIGMNQDDDDVNLKPGWCREIWNAIPKNGYSKTGIQNLKGSTIRTNASLAAGTNTCIGTFPDKQNNRIVYFEHNSNDDHSIWYFSPITNTHTLIMQTEFLAFSLSFPILSCTFNEDIMEWTDNNNETRSLIVSRAVAGNYNFNTQEKFEQQVSLYKTPPRFPPTSSYPRETGTSGFNNITSDSYQYAVQYVYYDNTVSLMSPLSKLNPADVFPSSTNTLNLITVSHTVDTAIYGVIKKIYWIYLKNDDGNFQLFRETDLDTVDPSRATPSRTVEFYGTDTVETIFPTQVNFIPTKSKNVVIHDQRSIITMNEFDYEQSGITITATPTSLGVTPPTTRQTKICAPNSSYTLGFLFFDRSGRTPGITATKTVVIPNIKLSNPLKTGLEDQDFIDASDQLRIAWSVAGTVPSWAKACAIALKPNNTFETIYACLALPMFYISEAPNDSGGSFQDGPTNTYHDTLRTYNWDRKVHWKVPENIPFPIDSSYKLRLINSGLTGQTRDVEDILSVQDGILITENFGILRWDTAIGGVTKGMFNVIIEKYKEEQDEVFFEVGQHFDCSGGSLAAVTGYIEGDYYYMPSKLQYSTFIHGDIHYGGVFADLFENTALGNSGKGIEVPVISQSPTHATSVISDFQTSVEKTKKGLKVFKKALGIAGGLASLAPGVGGIIGKTASAVIGTAGQAAIGVSAAIETPDDSVTTVESVKLVYTPNYNKVVWDSGRGWIDTKNKEVSHEPNTLSISDPYVINSKVNGLSEYRNLYQIPAGRSEITKLVSIGASNVLLAIHQRTTTSIATYSGKVLNTSDGSQILGDGNEIVGYNNELRGGYGTIYPDSVVHHYDRVWYFDPYSGEVIRYSNNGLTPIGSIYKMHNFFREKGDQFIDPTGRNVIGGYDANLDILYMTFRSDIAEEEITVAFIDRQGEERWICFTDFLPERYAYINERLFGFVNGEMWEMNINETRNLFFGVQYTTSVKHLFNPEFSKEKMLTNVGVESNKKWAFNPITVAKFGVDQETRLAKSNFVRRDDLFYADLKRDVNTAVGLIPAGKSALVAGQPMIGKVYEITLENDDTELVELDFLNYGYIPQSGHNIV